MKKTLIFLFILSLISCKNYLINLGLTNIGAYEDIARLETVNYEGKNIVFIPMHHLGTESFYNDVKTKIDSLKNKDHYFLYEEINLDRKDDKLMRKFKKIIRLPIPKPNVGYKNEFDSLYPNIKYKKELINQFSHEKLGLDDKNSKNVDVEVKDIINYYEKKYGEIKLTDCDYQTSIYENYTKCKEENRVPMKQRDDVLVNFRNDVVVQKIKESPHQKIAIIYGAEHMEGILKKLSEQEKK